MSSYLVPKSRALFGDEADSLGELRAATRAAYQGIRP